MLYVIPPYDHELSLAVQAEGVDNAKPGLSPAGGSALQIEPGAGEFAEHQRKDRQQCENDGEGDGPNYRCRQRISQQRLQRSRLPKVQAAVLPRSR